MYKWEFDVGELIRVTWNDQTYTFEAQTPVGGQWVTFDEMVDQSIDDPNEAVVIAHGWAEELCDE